LQAALTRSLGRAGLPVAGVVAIAFARFVWDVPEGVLAQGAIIGALTSLLALGIALADGTGTDGGAPMLPAGCGRSLKPSTATTTTAAAAMAIRVKLLIRGDLHGPRTTR